MDRRRAGLVLRGADALYFIEATVARSLVPRPEVSMLPGTELGMALVAGAVVPVLTLGERAGALVVCDVEGELIAFSGLVPEASGFFPAAERGVTYAGELATELDVAGRRTEAERSLTASRRGFLYAAP